MRTEVRICFTTKTLGGAQDILGAAGCGPDVATVTEVPVLRHVDVWVRLEETDPRIPILREIIERHGRRWLDWHEDRYTEEELDSARLLLMHANRQCEIDGGVKWGTTYDLSGACPACGTGGRQTSALFVDGEQLANLDGHRAGGLRRARPPGRASRGGSREHRYDRPLVPQRLRGDARQAAHQAPLEAALCRPYPAAHVPPDHRAFAGAGLRGVL